jgi:PAS domain S-box-containing protein
MSQHESSPNRNIRELEREARFFAASLDLFVILDLQGIIRLANAQFERTLGHTPSEAAGRPVFEFVAQEDHQRVRDQIQASANGQETVDFECRCVHRDGSLRWLACSCPPVSPGEDELLVVCHDITDQKKLQLELLAWKNRYDAAAQASGNVLYEWDTASERIARGSNAARMFGVSPGELGDGLDAWMQRIHPDDRGNAVRAYDQARADRRPIHLEYRVQRFDGNYIHVRDDAQFLRDGDRPSDRLIGCLKDVSEHRWAEERFRRLVETSPTGIILVDADGRIAFANPQAELQFGYSADELQGAEIELLIPQRFHQQHRQARAKYLRAPSTRPIGTGSLLWGRRKDGHEFPVDIALTPMTTQDRWMVVCTIVDLSEQVHAKKALTESDRRLDQILDNATAVVYLKNAAGRYLLINRQFEELFQVTRTQVVGKTDYDIFPREMADAFRANDQRVLASGEVLKVEELAPHGDGPHTYISVKFPLRDSEGLVYAIAGISTDISDRVRDHQQVERVQRRMELILNSIGEGIFGVDRDGKVTFSNPAAKVMLGKTPKQEMGGAHFVEVPQTQMDGTPVREEDNPIQAALRSGLVHEADDKMFLRQDGTPFPVEYRSTPLEEHGQLVGAVVTFRDATERIRRIRTEQELQAARRVQQHLYPKSAPQLPGFDVAGAVFPASEACGDYFDFIPLPNKMLALVVGDVAGHGLGPALQMVQTRAYLRAMLGGGIPPAEAVHKLNMLLTEDTPQEAFVTLFMAVVDAQQRSLVYVGAGHEARLLRASGVVENLESTGLVLGVIPDAPLRRGGPKFLASGDILLILTDGVLEALSPRKELFGWERTLETIRRNRSRSAKEIIDSLYAAVCEFCPGQKQNDDVTVLVAKAL